jgi:hypothetical protein
MEEEEFYSSEEEQAYDPATPYVVDVVDDDRRQLTYNPLLWKNQFDFNPSFELPAGVNGTPAALCELYLPDSLLDKWVVSTNAYASSHLPQHKRRNITRIDILRFLSAVSYMGVVRLPAKVDYFANDNNVLPHHHAIKMNRSLFEYVWRNFHTSFKAGSRIMDEEIDDNDDDEEEEPVDEEEDSSGSVADATPPTWFGAVEAFIDHINNASKKLCKHPGKTLSLDEMLKKFKGRSAQTFRMARKPGKEGYKFFASSLHSSITSFQMVGLKETNWWRLSVGLLTPFHGERTVGLLGNGQLLYNPTGSQGTCC